MRKIEKRDINALEGYFKQEKGILIAYLFGSQCQKEIVKSKGKPRDIDIAILFDHDVSLRELLTIRADITSLFRTEKIDVVPLNNASPLLKYEVVAGGRVIYKKGDDILFNFEMKALSHFMDTHYLRETQREYLVAEFGKGK